MITKRQIHNVIHRLKIVPSLARSILTLAFVYFLKNVFQNRKVVLINLADHMGDIIACLPVAEHIKSEDPKAFIVWAVSHRFRDLVLNAPCVDRVIIANCIREINVLRRAHLFDRCIDLHLHGRACHICMSFLEKPTNLRQITLSNYYDTGALLEAFSLGAGLPRLTGQPNLQIPMAIRAKVDTLDLPANFISIHCDSIEEKRNWPVHLWNDLVSELLKNHRVIEIGTKPILNMEDPRFLSFAGRLSILESAEVIRRSTLFIGIDSGPAHLANAMKTKGVLILGKYNNFKNYLPYTGFYADPNNGLIVSNPESISKVTVEAVRAAIDKHLENLSI